MPMQDFEADVGELRGGRLESIVLVLYNYSYNTKESDLEDMKSINVLSMSTCSAVLCSLKL